MNARVWLVATVPAEQSSPHALCTYPIIVILQLWTQIDHSTIEVLQQMVCYLIQFFLRDVDRQRAHV
eukprot:scaffold910_cov396-Prasinococcus_capsulatus_cf.AAC.46